LKMKRNRLDIFSDIIAVTLLAGVTLYLALVWDRLPEWIPAHYNAQGLPDRMGSKAELWFLPATGWFLYALLSVVSRYPQIWNTGVKVTEANAERVRRVIQNLLRTMKMILASAFVYLTVSSANVLSLCVWFLPVFLILTFGTIGYCIWQLIRVR